MGESAGGIGVLRLRRNFASLGSCSAQDDNAKWHGVAQSSALPVRSWLSVLLQVPVAVLRRHLHRHSSFYAQLREIDCGQSRLLETPIETRYVLRFDLLPGG